MRPSLVFAILLALAAGGAESPPAPTEPLPDARLFYESDTRAYSGPVADTSMPLADLPGGPVF